MQSTFSSVVVKVVLWSGNPVVARAVLIVLPILAALAAAVFGGGVASACDTISSGSSGGC